MDFSNICEYPGCTKAFCYEVELQGHSRYPIGIKILYSNVAKNLSET
ncbi:10861_t:CDS:2 [Entrophospora sp. SA101]|nr:10861_t:CDS:2 [Entrophospora sp. SA101]